MAGMARTGTMYRVDPKARLVVLLMVQLLPNATDIHTKFPTLVYQAMLAMPSDARRNTTRHR